jgi:hypothetical protein
MEMMYHQSVNSSLPFALDEPQLMDCFLVHPTLMMRTISTGLSNNTRLSIRPKDYWTRSQRSLKS